MTNGQTFYSDYQSIPMGVYKSILFDVIREYGEGYVDTESKVLNIINSIIEENEKSGKIGITSEYLKTLYVCSYLSPKKLIISEAVNRFINSNKSKILPISENKKEKSRESVLVYDKLDLRFRLGLLALGNFKSEATKDELECSVDLGFIKEGLMYKLDYTVMLTLRFLLYLQKLLNEGRLPYVELYIDSSNWKITKDMLCNYGKKSKENYMYSAYWYNLRKDAVSLEYLRSWLLSEDPILNDNIMYDMIKSDSGRIELVESTVKLKS